MTARGFCVVAALSSQIRRFVPCTRSSKIGKSCLMACASKMPRDAPRSGTSSGLKPSLGATALDSAGRARASGVARSGIATGDGAAAPGSALTGPLTTLPKSGAGGRAPPVNPGTVGGELGAYGKPDGAAPNPGCGGTPTGAAVDETDGRGIADVDGSAPDGIAGVASAGNEPGSGAEDGASGADANGTCADCRAAALGVTGASGAPLGALGSPACSKKYSVALGVRESALSINSS